MWAKGSPGSTSPSNDRNSGRTGSSRAESVMSIAVSGCAAVATSPQTPRISSMRRVPAAMAKARRPGGLAKAGSCKRTDSVPAEPCRSASASARPASPPPAISTSQGGSGGLAVSGIMLSLEAWRC